MTVLPSMRRSIRWQSVIGENWSKNFLAKIQIEVELRTGKRLLIQSLGIAYKGRQVFQWLSI
jgi:hypothetical protein